MVHYATYTDAGRRKKGNQDSHCLLQASTPFGSVVMAVVCDGVGGLSGGEVASSSLVQQLASWFTDVLPRHAAELAEFGADGRCEFLQRHWGGILHKMNAAIFGQARERGSGMGTTVTGMLLVGDSFQIVQVGDCRAYRVSDGVLQQLTEDQTLVQREVLRGNLTPEEARNHPKGNVILQAVGAQEVLEPVYSCGAAQTSDVFLLCSDGFCHKVSPEELQAKLAPLAGSEDFQMQDTLEGLVRTTLERGERDNITALCFCQQEHTAPAGADMNGTGTFVRRSS